MKLRILSYNVRGLTGHKLDQILTMAKDVHLDIILLQETHLSSTIEQEKYLENQGWTSVWHSQSRKNIGKEGLLYLSITIHHTYTQST